MPRAQVYITQNNYKRIKSIVDAKKEDGADRTEANVSSVSAMLLDIGLRVYEFQQKKELEGVVNSESETGNNLSDLVVLDKTIVENILKTSYASTILLQMVASIEGVKEMEVFKFERLREGIKHKARVEIDKLFPD